MTASKVKAVEKQKSSEASSLSPAFVRRPGIGISQGDFGTASVPHMAGNLAVQQLFLAGAIQAKLSISQPNDPDEQEADRAADEVMRMAANPSIHRKCAACAIGVPCPKCEQDEHVHTKEAAGHRRDVSAAGRLPLALSRSPGQPLPAEVRSFFEPRFGTDFSGVRIHDGSAASDAARSIGARAFTIGRDVGFAAGEYAPNSPGGKRLLAHELTHVIQQRNPAESGGPWVVQRQDATPGTTPTPAPPPPSPAPPAATPTPTPASDVLEKEAKAFDTAKGRVGQAAATVLFSNPNSPSTMNSPELETFTIGEVLDRNAGDPIRHGFDTQGPATAYAAARGSDIGGAVLAQDKFFFAAKLNKGSHDLRVTDPPWWHFTRDFVYRVTPNPGVVSVTGMGGFNFPLNEVLEVDPGRARFLKDPKMATPADAESMRSVAGAPPIGQKDAGKVPEQAEIPEAQYEAFIISYFRARGLETLAFNEKETDRLAEIFKPTDPGSSTKDPSGVSNEAMEIIAADRQQLRLYAELLEEEVKVEALLSFLAVCEERGEFPPFYPLWVANQKPQVVALANLIRGRRADIQQRKAGMLAASPLIGQLIGMPDPKSRFKEAERVRVDVVEYLQVPTILGTGYTQVSESLLAQPANPANDEKIRAQFEKKLDAVRKAIRDTRSEMLGDSSFLLGMEGLQAVVTQDLSKIKGKNAGLNVKLKELIQAHGVKEKIWSAAEIVIQVGLLFVPGAGPFLSTLAGFAISAKHVAADLRRWTASQASVNPATAMVDQRVVEAQLARNTIELAANAVFMAMETITALKTLESGKGAEKLENTLKKLEEQEAKQAKEAGEMVVKPDVAGVRGEVGGIPDAFGGSAHELRIGERGIERCSFVCWIFSASLQSRAKNVKASLKATPEITKEALALEAKAESLGARAAKLAELPEPQRSIKEGLLLGEARAVEMEMYELEHKVLGMPGTRLPAKGQGKWTGTPGDSNWIPPEGSPAYWYTGEKGVPFHGGYPNLREWALPGSDVSIPNMTGVWGYPVSADFAAADAIAAARSGMADAAAFKAWRDANGYTWHHVENSMTMLLVPEQLHGKVAHAGGGMVARGIPVPPPVPVPPVP